MQSKLILGVVAILGSVALAHNGPRVWIGYSDGKISTFDSDNDIDPSVFCQSRLFLSGGEEESPESTGSFEDDPGSFTTMWPGYQVKPGTSAFSPTTQFGFNITGPLLKFDPQTDTFRSVNDIFAGASAIPKLVVSQNANIRFTSTGAVTGFNFIQANSHAHLDLTYWGDGTQSGDGPAGSDGIYALPLELKATGFNSSDTYYVLMGKNVAVGTHEYTEAQRVAKELVNLVPSHTWDAGIEQPTLLLRNQAVVTIPANGTSTGVSKINKLIIEPANPAGTAFTGTLQLHDNDLIVDYAGGPSPYDVILLEIKSGLVLLGGNGTGIASSEVDAQTLPGTMLGVVDNGAVGGAITSTSGYATSAQSVIVKYTWFGDSNLDGVVDGSDYALIDTGFTASGALTGWVFGDYDYNGVIDGSDYALIDTGFLSQSSTLPEPGFLAIGGIGVTCLLRRRFR